MPCATASSPRFPLAPWCPSSSRAALLLRGFRGSSGTSEHCLPLCNCLRLALNEGVQHHPNALLLLKAAPGRAQTSAPSFAAERAVLASLQKSVGEGVPLPLRTDQMQLSLCRSCGAPNKLLLLVVYFFFFLFCFPLVGNASGKGCLWGFFLHNPLGCLVLRAYRAQRRSPPAKRELPCRQPWLPGVLAPGAGAQRAGGPARERRTRQRVLCLHRLSPLQLQLFGTCPCLCA